MNPRLRLLLALLLPFVAAGIQWLLWEQYIKPYVWFLFFPAAFFSAWLGGLRGGIAGAVIGALLAWYVYIPPQFSFQLHGWAAGASILLFVAMGVLYAWIFERLTQAKRRTDAALAETRAANEKITELYQKTLELDELKSQFFANVSHELRTPLTLIMNPLQQRLSESGLSDNERHQNEMMLRNSRQLYRLVSDLLDAAKLEAGGMRAEYAHLDLARLLRITASNFDPMAREHAIQLQVEAPPELPMEGDGAKLERILLNLLSNALKFTPNGGHILLRLQTTEGTALLEVEDNGPGIPAALREAVFERFRQVDGSSQRRFGGTGLGLAIVREFAALHGGRAEVVAAPGGGALFRVWLPLQAPAGTPVQAQANPLDSHLFPSAVDQPATLPSPTQTLATAQPRVLVVEDNPDMNSYIADLLRPHYQVHCAFDGRQGLEQALAQPPDLILADVMMPELSGDQMVAALRQRPELAELPIVMLTAKADDELRLKMLQLGVQDYLNKPFSADELLARVAGLLRSRQQAATQLQHSEIRFEATFQQAAVGIALVAPDGHWLRVNRKLCDIVGYSETELLNKTFQDITHPDDLDIDLAYVRRMLAREIDTYSMEKRYFRKDGEIVWINLTVSLVWKADDGPDYFIAVIEDISTRKTAEGQLRQRNEELERFDRAATGRELYMIELKREVNRLAQELGRIAPYDLSFADSPDSSRS